MSTSITVEVLQEMGKLKTKTGTTLLGASLFDDVFVIVILAVLMGMGGETFSVPSLLLILLKIAAFFAFAILTGFFINKLFNYMHNRFGQRRRLIIFALAYCFAMAYLAEWFGLADITGAYIAGIALCSTRCVESLETKAHGLSYMFFTPVFLANIGIHTTFSGMTGGLIAFTAALVVVAIASKLVGCGLGARLCGFTRRESVQIGTGMIARGEVSFIVAAKGIAVGYIGLQLFPSVIVVVLVTVLIAPLLLKAAFAKDA
jgi:Kef-type K+ transport system membrane component KefB